MPFLRSYGKFKTRGSLSFCTEFVLACERAVEDDLRLYNERRPAVEKLKLCKRMEELCRNKSIAKRLLEYGFLGVLKAWIELMPDGTLPNVRVRNFNARYIN